MKRLLLTAFALVAIALPLSAQEGKPIYAIDVFRADTTLGQFTVELFPDIAPLHVRNFDSLVAIGFYDSTAFHRVIPGFVIQGGDPNTKYLDQSTWGIGDSTQTTVPAEFNPISHRRGILSAARSDDPNSATSQFFVVVAPATHLDRQYTAYGRVISGMNIVDSIVNAPTEPNQFGEKSRPITKIIMNVRRIGLDTTRPAMTVLSGPSDDTTRVKPTVELQWNATPGAILYEVQVSKTPDFSVIALKDSVTGIKATVGPLEAGQQTYYWRVRASNGGRRGEFSEVRSFTTGIARPTLVAPANLATGVPKPVQLSWTPVDAAVSYRLQLATAIGFATKLLDTAGLTSPSLTVTGLAPNQRVFWRVFATDGAGDTTESTRWSFTTDAASAVETTAPATVALVVRASGTEVELDLTLAAAGTARLSLVDIEGRVLRSWSEDRLREGRNVIALDAGSLAAGMYHVRVETGGTSSVGSFVLVH